MLYYTLSISSLIIEMFGPIVKILMFLQLYLLEHTTNLCVSLRSFLRFYIYLMSMYVCIKYTGNVTDDPSHLLTSR